MQLGKSMWMLATMLTLSYANTLCAEQRINEPLGFGVYNTVANSEAETAALFERYKNTGVKVLYPSLSGGGSVIWKTDHEVYYPPLREAFEGGYDALESFIRHAHQAGIKVYPSVAVGPITKPAETNPLWETHDREGNPSSLTAGPSLAMSYPQARAAKIKAIMDLVNHYDIDGLMLDYCRYPETTKTKKTAYGFYGYDQPIIDACKALHGFDPREVEIDSPQWNIFNDMRIASVNALVRELKGAIDASGRDIRLGGYGDTKWEHEAKMCGRDWIGWANLELIDDVFIATYTETINEMPDVVSRARASIPQSVKLNSALSPFNGFLKTPEEMKAAALAQLRAGADSVWVYREDFLDTYNLWRTLQPLSRMVKEAQK